MKIKLKLIYIPIMLMILLCVVMVGLTDYITTGFTLEVLKKADFWINLTMVNIGNISIIIAIILMCVDKYCEQNSDYLYSLEQINKFRKEKYIAPMFNMFCNEDNLKTKIIYYKHKIERKYTKLKPTPQDLIIYNSGTEEEKANNKYCQKVEYYNTLLSDDFIQNNIKKLHVRYPMVTPSLIFCGFTNSSVGIDHITQHKTRKIIIDYLPKFLISFSITVIISSIFPDLKDGITIATVIRTIAKLFTVVMQIFYSYNYAGKYNTEVTLHDIQYRETKINEYIIWESKQLAKLRENKISQEQNNVTQEKEELNNGNN